MQCNAHYRQMFGLLAEVKEKEKATKWSINRSTQAVPVFRKIHQSLNNATKQRVANLVDKLQWALMNDDVSHDFLDTI